MEHVFNPGSESVVADSASHKIGITLGSIFRCGLNWQNCQIVLPPWVIDHGEVTVDWCIDVEECVIERSDPVVHCRDPHDECLFLQFNGGDTVPVQIHTTRHRSWAVGDLESERHLGRSDL